jgi:hypothetical protein
VSRPVPIFDQMTDDENDGGRNNYEFARCPCAYTPTAPAESTHGVQTDNLPLNYWGEPDDVCPWGSGGWWGQTAERPYMQPLGIMSVREAMFHAVRDWRGVGDDVGLLEVLARTKVDVSEMATEELAALMSELHAHGVSKFWPTVYNFHKPELCVEHLLFSDYKHPTPVPRLHSFALCCVASGNKELTRWVKDTGACTHRVMRKDGEYLDMAQALKVRPLSCADTSPRWS